ncbi:hypothetical protein ACFQ3Y_24885 [Paenibacillus motobuensis]
MRNKEAAQALREAWRELMLAVVVSLKIDKLCTWLADKLTKEDGK